MDPLSTFAAGVSSSIKILEVCFLLQAVGEQTRDLLRTTEHVNRNIIEARRLRSLKASLVDGEERTWIDATIDDTEKALLEIAQLIEPARVDTSIMYSISSKNKVLWVFRDSPKVKDKHNRLSLCHQTLVTVINVLYAKNVVIIAPPPAEKPEDQPPPYSSEMEAMFNWRSQKRRRKSFTNLKAPNTNPISHPPRPTSSNSLFLNPESKLTHACSELPDPCSEISRKEERLTTARPSAFNSSFDGADGLQVQDLRSSTDSKTADLSPPVSDFWSPVGVLPDDGFSSGTSPNHDKATHQQSVPVPLLTYHSSKKECDVATALQSPIPFASADHESVEKSRPGLGRMSSRSRGRQWLVHYASQSEGSQGMDQG